MRILIMGGTRFIGVHLTKMLVEQGHNVVLFNRGNRPTPVEGVSQIQGDRTEIGQQREPKRAPSQTRTLNSQSPGKRWAACRQEGSARGGTPAPVHSLSQTGQMSSSSSSAGSGTASSAAKRVSRSGGRGGRGTHRPVRGLVDVLERHGRALGVPVLRVVRVAVDVVRAHEGVQVRAELSLPSAPAFTHK